MVMIMNFLENATVKKITHASIVSYNFREHSRMCKRPWYGIAFSLGGEITYIHNSKKIKLSGDTVVFIPKNITYETVCIKEGRFAVVNFLTADNLNVDNFVSSTHNNTEAVKQYFDKMYNCFGKSRCEAMSLIYKIFEILVADNLKNTVPAPLDKALAFINENISSDKLCNTCIAEHVGISEVYLRKLFSKHMSVSVNNHIQNMRVENAKKLLCETSLSISEIAEICGYSCIYYFCRSFKKKTNYTPTQYRRAYNLF